MHSRTLSLCLLFVGLFLGNQTLFSQLVLHSSDQGNIELGPYGMSHDSSSQSYRLGMDPVTSLIGIPYFVFDIPDFAQAIESVTLSIYNPADVNAGDFLLFDQGFDNTSSPAEISLWDYSSDKSMFDTDFNTYFSPPGTTSEWDDDVQDLTSGTKYASTTVDSSSDGSWVNFYLNSDALIDIWTHQGGQFAMGASSENQAGSLTEKSMPLLVVKMAEKTVISILLLGSNSISRTESPWQELRELPFLNLLPMDSPVAWLW